MSLNRHANVDDVARSLAFFGAMAAERPKAYAADPTCRQPIYGGGKNGEILGWMIDGVGLLLRSDLRELGITKKLPHVIERSPISRLRDRLKNDHGAITTYDGIVAARAAGNYSDCIASKASYTTVANTWSSPYRAAGLPAAGAYTNIPGGSVKDQTDAGALSLLLKGPAVSTSDYLLTLGCLAGQQINCIMLVDLLVAAGNILLTAASNTVSSTALTRSTTGVGVYMTFEVTTAAGATAQNLTGTYTNSSAVGSRSTGAQAMTASAIVQRLVPVTLGPQTPLQSGDLGVQSVQTVAFSATNSAGVIALNLYKPLAMLPGIVANVYAEKPMASTIDGLVKLDDVSQVIGCLVPYVYTNTTSTGVLNLALRTCWG